MELSPTPVAVTPGTSGVPAELNRHSGVQIFGWSGSEALGGMMKLVSLFGSVFNPDAIEIVSPAKNAHGEASCVIYFRSGKSLSVAMTPKAFSEWLGKQ